MNSIYNQLLFHPSHEIELVARTIVLSFFWGGGGGRGAVGLPLSLLTLPPPPSTPSICEKEDLVAGCYCVV